MFEPRGIPNIAKRLLMQEKGNRTKSTKKLALVAVKSFPMKRATWRSHGG